ncbi:glycosyltransferase family 4 protein [Hyphomicrobium sp.]|uniref:glycosyltransferase family 4 protein n=1 Tax=Hyphomicrobium sp. TaxID=82 RepID=UPI0025B94C8A|nr:glycosyltransferase family 4 protein [Hyphomicrobium sp.]MCC7251230.1 glycosyltransferase family 4 protein [Hyphomicrobium sp.]
MTHPVSERIALVAPSAEAAAVLRHDLIEWLTHQGHRVLCLTPPGPGRYVLALRGIGAQHRVIDPPRARFRILDDWQEIAHLVSQLNDWQPNVVLTFGLRTLTLATVAARRAGVRRVVSLVNGLPSDGIESVGRRRFAHAIRASDAVVFHNRDNLATLTRLGLVPANLETLVVPGSGVDLKAFPFKPLPPLDDGPVFLMLSRLERRRGVLEYKAAAERLKVLWPNATFLLAGPTSSEPDAVAPEALSASGAVEYLGPLEDVRPALAACHVFVYPSYGEGMPRAALEALATGRPVVTTTTPGCADIVDEKVSGCLVPAADAASLAVAMESYINNPEQLAAGSRAARLKAERRFDVKTVNAALARVLGVA